MFGQGVFIPDPRWLELGTILTALMAVIPPAIPFYQSLGKASLAFLGITTMVMMVIIGGFAGLFIIMFLPDLYTQQFGSSSTIQVHPIRISPTSSRYPRLQAEIAEMPRLLGGIYLDDAPPSIKGLYSGVRGELHSAPPITLIGLRSAFGFHKTGFVTPGGQ
jgi:hypothetical protein